MPLDTAAATFDVRSSTSEAVDMRCVQFVETVFAREPPWALILAPIIARVWLSFPDRHMTAPESALLRELTPLGGIVNF